MVLLRFAVVINRLIEQQAEFLEKVFCRELNIKIKKIKKIMCFYCKKIQSIVE